MTTASPHRFLLALAWLAPLSAQAQSAPAAPPTAPTTPPPAPAAADDALRGVIHKAIAWIGRQAQPVDGDAEALLFPSVAEKPAGKAPQIYGGNAGVLVFLANAAKVLPSDEAAALAKKLRRGLLSLRGTTAAGHASWMGTMTEGSASLYCGDAGIGQAFLVCARLTGDEEALRIAIETGDAIVARAQREGETLFWDKQVEVIYGAAGTILFLLDLAEVTKEKRFLAAAEAAGRWLIEEAKTTTKKAEDGTERQLRSWRWQLGGNAPYVNFSHGTAGVAYALARVGSAAGNASCAAAARDGVAWMAEQAKREGETLSWPVVARSKMTIGSWCHGAPGTGRLYLLLHKITGDAEHLTTARAAARWVVAQAPPAGSAANPKFPASFCCGVAGVLDFFCDLYRATGEAEWKEFALRAGDYLVGAATADGDGLKWAPGATAHGGREPNHPLDLMLGTPGEALALLRLLTIDAKPDPVCHLPDRRVQ